jgi:SAM-dependent methyltransferase
MGPISSGIAAVMCAGVILRVANHFSYHYLKNRILRRERWGLNICCGRTDGGGINADIVRHANLPNFVLLNDIYNLPFKDDEFESVLCSHAMEHVDDPKAFHAELRRISKRVVILLPPLWDIAAALNVFEHKWLFLTGNTEHERLPRHIPLPLSRRVQRVFGQSVRA